MTKSFVRMKHPLGLFLLVGALLFASPAFAHKILVFATAEGREISGYVYFSGGQRAANVHITASDPAGVVLFTGETDAQGVFHFPAGRATDHRIKATTDDGHSAEILISATERPQNPRQPNRPLWDLWRSPSSPTTPDAPPPPPAPLPPPMRAPVLPPPRTPAPPEIMPTSPEVVPAPPEVVNEALLEQVVARQVRPLREQLDAYQNKIWWHDVVGGLGYIVGLGGLAFGLMRRKSPPS